MSILAEPRRKQRLSVDPQNLQWKDDKQKLSRRLMERMGWSEGDGLGRNRQGQAGQLKLKANYSGKGLGADKLSSYDSTWIGHHEDFADILNYLNKLKEQNSVEDEQKEEQVKKISLELNSKNLRRRIHYQKFVRSKDVSNYSPNDRFAIIGMGLSRIKPGDSEKMEPSKKTERRSDGVYSSDSKTTVSTLSVNEYFAVKMAALKARTEQTVNETKVVMEEDVPEMEVSEEMEQYTGKKKTNEQKKIRKELKGQRSLKHQTPNETCEIEVKPFDEEEELSLKTEKDRKKRRKIEKKRRRMEQLEFRVDQDSELEVICSDYDGDDIPKGHKRTRERVEESEAGAIGSEGIIYKARKGKRKRRNLSEE